MLRGMQVEMSVKVDSFIFVAGVTLQHQRNLIQGRPSSGDICLMDKLSSRIEDFLGRL